MDMDRRQFLYGSAAAVAMAGQRACPAVAAPAGDWSLRIGVTDWDLLGIHYLKHSTPKPEAIGLAKRLGFDGLEINLGRRPDHIPLNNPQLQERFVAESEQHELPIASTCLDILHQNYLKSDPLGPRWVRQSIAITRRLGARVVLLPFFGQGGLQERAEMDRVADILKELGPHAEQADVTLGLENTLSAKQNAYILDRAGSPAVRIYYDVGNSSRHGYDVLDEIRWLGAERICQFHLKDNPHYLGEGDLDFSEIFQTIQDIGFHGWGMLETNSPSGDVRADMRRNLHYVRRRLQDNDQ